MDSDRLDSWKEIAAYLKRSVRTVTRWEREEGLPVHRHVHARAGTVFAYKAELDAWWGGRADRLGAPSAEDRDSGLEHSRYRLVWVISAAVSLIVAVMAATWLSLADRPSPPAVRLVPLTTYPGIEGPPSLSPDGNQVTFERDGDIFVKQVDGEALVRLTNTTQTESAPAWSPDGRAIAFTRADEGIFVVSPLGGGERKIAGTHAPLLLKAIAWTPDASSLIVSELTSPICASLFVVSVATGQKTRLTAPPEPSIGDGWPAVSPDGRTVAFARYSQDATADIHVVALTGGELRQLTVDKASIFGLAWSTNSELIFSSGRSGTSRLWRASVTGADRTAVAPLDGAGEDARFPSSARLATSGARPRLAYQRFVEDIDIRRAEIVAEGTRRYALKASQPFIASTQSDDHPRYSPDGMRIAFVSRRSGTYEIWVSDSDAANPVRLTSMEGPIVAAPQWSPDGRQIAYFASAGLGGRYAIYLIDSQGGRPSRLTRTDAALEALPVWSSDGQSIYLASGRSGSLQIWRIPRVGNEPLQITANGGAEACPSPDGRAVFYAKVPEAGPGLWSVPADGGAETRVLQSARFGYWAVVRDGIYFVDFDVARDVPRPVKFFSLQSREVTQVGEVEPTVAWTNTPGFAVSPDGRWLLYTSLERSAADLMLVDSWK